MKCFLCNKDNFSLEYTLKTKQILRCKNDNIFISQTASKTNKLLYGRTYYQEPPYSSNFNMWYFQNKLDEILKIYRKKNISILDVGCGWGDFLEIVKKAKIPYLGIDTSKEAIGICRSKKLNCKYVDVQTLSRISSQKYTVITCFQTIEHLPNPISFLKSVRSLLHKNGIIIFTTPNNDSPFRKILGPYWPVYNTDSHFVFFDSRTLQKTLKKSGFYNIIVDRDSIRLLLLRYIWIRLFSCIPPKILQQIPIGIITDPFGDLKVVGYKTRL
ncbi:MAG: class I SAM-dependent methyltransferase [bacterium]|nr:class I SAM-dependent methyltransferase [bacterium]